MLCDARRLGGGDDDLVCVVVLLSGRVKDSTNTSRLGGRRESLLDIVVAVGWVACVCVCAVGQPTAVATVSMCACVLYVWVLS